MSLPGQTRLPAAQDVFAAIVEIGGARELQTAWQMTTAILARFGFDRLNYGYSSYRQGNAIGDPDAALYLSNHPPEVARAYFRGGLYAHTPMFRWVMENSGACSWRWAQEQYDAGTLKTGEAEVQHLMMESGIGAGYSISFPTNTPRFKGAIGLSARADLDQDSVDTLWRDRGREIEALCITAHLRLSQLPVPEPRLTPRQSEILDWVTDGKSARDIGLLTGLPASVIEKHLRNIRERLGVGTTQQAVLKAAFMRQLFQFPQSPPPGEDGPELRVVT